MDGVRRSSLDHMKPGSLLRCPSSMLTLQGVHCLYKLLHYPCCQMRLLTHHNALQPFQLLSHITAVTRSPLMPIRPCKAGMPALQLVFQRLTDTVLSNAEDSSTPSSFSCSASITERARLLEKIHYEPVEAVLLQCDKTATDTSFNTSPLLIAHSALAQRFYCGNNSSPRSKQRHIRQPLADLKVKCRLNSCKRFGQWGSDLSKDRSLAPYAASHDTPLPPWDSKGNDNIHNCGVTFNLAILDPHTHLQIQIPLFLFSTQLLLEILIKCCSLNLVHCIKHYQTILSHLALFSPPLVHFWIQVHQTSRSDSESWEG